MKRFDKAIKVLQDELYREAGKASIEFAKHGRVELSSQTMRCQNIKKAIDILQNHESNKLV
jgi:hypothetical protein